MVNLEEKLKRIKLIVSEIDGVVTEDLSAMDTMGYVIFKQYYMKDFAAINELKKTFIFVFTSADDVVNFKVCRDRNIPFFFAKRDKKEELVKIMQRYEVTPEEILYIGSTFSDVGCMQTIPLSVCPSDSVFSVLNLATHILRNPSGMGVLCEVYEWLQPEMLRRIRED